MKAPPPIPAGARASRPGAPDDRAFASKAAAKTPPPIPAGARPPQVDLPQEGGISLAPLELGFGGGDGDAAPPFDAAAPPDRPAAREPEPEPDAGPPGLSMDVALELVERKPAARTAAGLGSLTAGGSAERAAGSASTEASAAVASLLQAEAEAEPGADAMQPVRLDETAPPPEVKVRRRTMTAARGGVAASAVIPGWRPSRRVVLVGAAIIVLGASGIAAVVLDLPDRLRGEPDAAAALGPLAAEIAQDRFPAYSEGARRLEAAVGGRRHAPKTSAAAAELLATSVVLHGGEHGRIARAEALLNLNHKTDDKTRGQAIAARTRALGWVALAKGRWKDAERIVAEVALDEGNRAAISGWAALGREDAARAVNLFTAAGRAEPAPAPGRTATRYALARAREADLSPAAEAAYRAVLADAPGHVGAALGLARVSKLLPDARIKLVETLIAKQASDASRAELAEAHVLIARAAQELGDTTKAEAALKRAREAEPAAVAAAVAAGDALLADGRTDEAVARYRLALAAPVSAARTSWLRFARVAALVESARSVEAAAALDELDRRLPGDARVSFWRGRLAELKQPPDAAAADRAYREALTRDPKFLPASLQLARYLVEQRRGADALVVLRRAETHGAAPVALRIALGQALRAAGNNAEAARAFRQALAADSKNAAAHLGLAGALEAMGRLEEARAELAALAVKGQGGVKGLGSRVAAILIKLGRKDEALVAYQNEIAAGGAAPATKVAAARLAIELGRKDVARSFAESAVSDDPRTPGALLTLADVRRAEGDLGSALSELRRALAVDGSAEVQLEYGRALAALGRDEEALSALAQAREIPEAGVERGRILLRRGDVEAAAKELSTATSSLPTHAEAFLLLGQAEDRLGHVTRAEAAWKSAVRLTPTSAESRYRLGRLQMDHSQATVALPHLRAAAEHIGPRGTGPAEPSWRPDLYFQLGFAEIRQGSRDRALAAFRRYLEVAPQDAPARVEVTRQIHEIVP
jgi:tetratricopeptide (TPR) repeat protein